MRIIIVRPNTSDFGKVGTYNVQEVGLAKALRKKGHVVYVLFLHKTVNEIEVDKTYDFVYYLPHKTFGLHGIFDTSLLTKFSPEKVILFSDNQLWAKNVIEWCKLHDILCIQYMGNVLSDNPNWLHQLYTKIILKRNISSYHYSLNVAKTSKVKEEMIDLKVPFAKVISIGLDKDLLENSFSPDDKIREMLGVESKEIRLLFVGRLVDYKKPFLACDILNELHKRNSNFKMFIIGKGPLQNQLKKYIEDNHLIDFVDYIERVPYDEMYKYMVASDCFINLSAQEIFGMAILEAMYYKLPVIVRSAPGPNDFVTHRLNGYVLNNDNVYNWCDTILEALANRKQIGEKAHQLILEKYIWDNIAEEFLSL